MRKGLKVVQLFWKPCTNSTRELPDFLTCEVSKGNTEIIKQDNHLAWKLCGDEQWAVRLLSHGQGAVNLPL